MTWLKVIGAALVSLLVGYLLGVNSTRDSFERCHAAIRVLSEGAPAQKLQESNKALTGDR